MAFSQKQLSKIGSLDKLLKSPSKTKTVTLVEQCDVKQRDRLLRITENDQLIILLRIGYVCVVYRLWDGSLALLEKVSFAQPNLYVVVDHQFSRSEDVRMSLRYAVAVTNYENHKLKLSPNDVILILASQSDRLFIGITAKKKLCVVPASVVKVITKPRLFIESKLRLTLNMQNSSRSTELIKVPKELFEFNVIDQEGRSVSLHLYEEIYESVEDCNAVLIPDQAFPGASFVHYECLSFTRGEEKTYMYSDEPVYSQESRMRPPPSPGTDEQIQAGHYTAIYDYKKQDEDEVELKEGDIVEVCEPICHGWCFVRVNGNLGRAPSNYLAKIDVDSDENSDDNSALPSTGNQDCVFREDPDPHRVTSEEERGLSRVILKEEGDLFDEDWFHGPMSRGEAESILFDEGDFLFRFRTDGTKTVVCSYCIEKGTFVHTKDIPFLEDGTLTPAEVRACIKEFMQKENVLKEYNGHVMQFKRTPGKIERTEKVYASVQSIAHKTRTDEEYGPYDPIRTRVGELTMNKDASSAEKRERADILADLRKYNDTVVSEHGLPETVAEHLEEDKLDSLGQLLGVPLNIRGQIRRTKEEVMDRSAAVIREWCSRRGSEATLGILLNALIEVDPGELTTMLTDLLDAVQVDEAYDFPNKRSSVQT